MLFRVGIEMEPFRREDNDAFLHDIICEGGEDAEYDGSQYLNDTGEGDADQSERYWQPKLVLKFIHTYICSTS